MSQDTRTRRASVAPRGMQATPSPEDGWEAASAGEASPEASFTRYSEIDRCPRCQSDTRHADACPVCLLPISDDVVETAQAKARTTNARRLLTAAFLIAATFIQIEGLALGFAMGRNSVGVAQESVARASEAATKRVFQSMDRGTRLRHQAAQLQNLFAGGLLPAYKIRFTRRHLKGQPAPAPRDSLNVDVTYVATTDGEWRQLAADERMMLIAGLAESHARFLALAGAEDTSRFVAVISVVDPGTTDTDHERILALRDRNGRLFLR